jgi:hypothetical protein
VVWHAPSAEVTELASQTGAISVVSSLVTAPISLLPPVALLSCKSQAIHPTARASAESACTTEMVAGVAQHLLWVCKVLVLVKSPPNFVDSNQGRIGIKGGLLLAAAFERNEGAIQ